MDMSLSKLQELVKDRESLCAAVRGSQRVGHNWVTNQQQTGYHLLGLQWELWVDSCTVLRTVPWHMPPAVSVTQERWWGPKPPVGPSRGTSAMLPLSPTQDCSEAAWLGPSFWHFCATWNSEPDRLALSLLSHPWSLARTVSEKMKEWMDKRWTHPCAHLLSVSRPFDLYLGPGCSGCRRSRGRRAGWVVPAGHRASWVCGTRSTEAEVWLIQSTASERHTISETQGFPSSDYSFLTTVAVPWSFFLGFWSPRDEMRVFSQCPDLPATQPSPSPPSLQAVLTVSRDGILKGTVIYCTRNEPDAPLVPNAGF